MTGFGKWRCREILLVVQGDGGCGLALDDVYQRLNLEKFRHYKVPGPVADAFIADRTSDVRALKGPVGSGKTVTCIFDSAKNAGEMPICTDGTIRFKLAVIGKTYGQLERNLFPTWSTWLPRDGGGWTDAEFTGGGGRFATHKIAFDILRKNQRVEVRYEAIFAAIGEYAVEEFMRGFEPTAFWFFEMDLLPREILPQAIFRLGRYPSRMMLPESTPLRGFPGYTLGNLPPGYTYETLPVGSLYRSYVVGDLNAPDIDSWFYQDFEEDRPPGYKLYAQPSGRSPRAENLHNLPPGYYARQVSILKKPNLIKRFVDSQYAPSSAGEPVFPEYSDELFLASEDLTVVKGFPLEAGIDAGLGNPAAVLGQQMPNGQFRNLGEISPGRMSAKRFVREVKLEVAALAQLSGLPSLRIEYAWGDPAGFDGADKEDGELAWMEQVMSLLDCPIEPAPSNEIALRLDAVRDEFVISGGVPMTLISRRCKKLRKAYASHYCYRINQKHQAPGEDAKPDKNGYSHIADADQYWKLGKKGRYGTISGERPGQSGHAATSGRGASCTQIKNTTRLFG